MPCFLNLEKVQGFIKALVCIVSMLLTHQWTSNLPLLCPQGTLYYTNNFVSFTIALGLTFKYFGCGQRCGLYQGVSYFHTIFPLLQLTENAALFKNIYTVLVNMVCVDGDCWLQLGHKSMPFLTNIFQCIHIWQQQQAWATDDVAQIYDKCMADLEQHLHAIPPALALNPQTQALRSLLEAVALARNSRDGIAALGLLQKVRWPLEFFH